MFFTRQHLEENEDRSLAPYGMRSRDTKGRAYLDTEPEYRTAFQRDRDRILHTTAFRRLEYKTQVFINFEGDHFRTRLTHTMEVAAISRTVARALALNEDLAEAVALAHDLGHPPFGHPGEHTLNELMKDHGGFEHNRQSLRVVEELEMKYPEFNGLNLSWETREGLCKRTTQTMGVGNQPSLEAQVADAADEIAYCCSDLDDALESGLVPVEDLAQLPLWKQLDDQVLQRYSRLDPERKRRYLIRCLIDHLVDDLCHQSAENILASGVTDADSVRTQPRRLVGFSIRIRAEVQNIRDFLLRAFYYHPDVSRINQRACQVLQSLFEFYHKHPHLIGPKSALRIKKEGLSRAVCDYVSGMTDGYALKSYIRHLGTDSLLQELLPGGNRLPQSDS